MFTNEVENQKKADVTDYIWNIQTTDEIHELWDLLKLRNKQLQERIATKFSIGDHVEWVHKRNGQVITGVIEKINQKSIGVFVKQTGNIGHWRVSPSLIMKVD